MPPAENPKPSESALTASAIAPPSSMSGSKSNLGIWISCGLGQLGFAQPGLGHLKGRDTAASRSCLAFSCA